MIHKIKKTTSFTIRFVDIFYVLIKTDATRKLYLFLAVRLQHLFSRKNNINYFFSHDISYIRSNSWASWAVFVINMFVWLSSASLAFHHNQWKSEDSKGLKLTILREGAKFHLITNILNISIWLSTWSFNSLGI